MKYRAAILALLFAWCVTANAQEQNGKIIFYRESHFAEFDYKPLLYCDGFQLGQIVNGSYMDVSAQPGLHECVAESADGPVTKIEVEPGSVVYQRIVITPTVKRHAVLTASDEGGYKKQKKLNRIATAELDSVQPLAPVVPLSETAQAKKDNQESPVGAAGPEKVFRPGADGVGYPRCVHCPDPQYTAKARHDRIEGTIHLTAVIGADGRANRIEVAQGLRQDMDEQAVEAVRNWRFEPARGPDGEPVAVVVPIEITFQMLR
jgi:TonB family protein